MGQVTRNETILWYVRNTRGWKPAMERYGLTRWQVKQIVRRASQNEAAQIELARKKKK